MEGKLPGLMIKRLLWIESLEHNVGNRRVIWVGFRFKGADQPGPHSRVACATEMILETSRTF